ncbi:Uncharacterized protein GBIM_18297 [Gryllus bimaculatus]|nr:Uncharacterized protein GBIM_18297 [Gryllus bimaculatus]
MSCFTWTFSNFLEKCLEVYGIDPTFYYSAPGLSWDAMLTTTGIQLELLTDIDMVLFFERGIRGGHVQVSDLEDSYQPSDKHSYLSFVDANNLSVYAMCYPLPTGRFSWLTPDELQTFNVKEAAGLENRGCFRGRFRLS